MDFNHMSHVVTVNMMDTYAMTQARIARLPKNTSEEELKATRSHLKEEMIDRVKKFNDWACETHKNNPRVIPFVQIDPILFGDKAIDELNRCIAIGAKGIKVHPNNCGHKPDHPNMMPVYQRMQEAGLWVLTDSTGHGAPRQSDANGVPFGSPMNWVPVLSTFPKLKFIMAHFCDIMWDDRVDLARQFKDNLWFDMSGGVVDEHHPSGGHSGLPAEQAVRVFRKVGTERIMFASDGPGRGDVDILQAAVQVVKAPFTEAEKVQILSGNAKRLLGLK
jgi:predicted TIM-barrel fold metal-dependent hydrolase